MKHINPVQGGGKSRDFSGSDILKIIFEHGTDPAGAYHGYSDVHWEHCSSPGHSLASIAESEVMDPAAPTPRGCSLASIPRASLGMTLSLNSRIMDPAAPTPRGLPLDQCIGSHLETSIPKYLVMGAITTPRTGIMHIEGIQQIINEHVEQINALTKDIQGLKTKLEKKQEDAEKGKYIIVSIATPRPAIKQDPVEELVDIETFAIIEDGHVVPIDALSEDLEGLNTLFEKNQQNSEMSLGKDLEELKTLFEKSQQDSEKSPCMVFSMETPRLAMQPNPIDDLESIKHIVTEDSSPKDIVDTAPPPKPVRWSQIPRLNLDMTPPSKPFQRAQLPRLNLGAVAIQNHN